MVWMFEIRPAKNLLRICLRWRNLSTTRISSPSSPFEGVLPTRVEYDLWILLKIVDIGREAGILPSLISSYLANFDNSFSSPSATGFICPCRVFKTLLTTRTLRSLRSLVAFTSRRSLSTLVTFRPLGPLEAVRPRRTRRPREAGRSTSSLSPGRTWGATRDVSWALNKEAGIWSHFCRKFLWAGRWIGVWCYISFVAIVNTSMVQWCCSFREVLVFK